MNLIPLGLFLLGDICQGIHAVIILLSKPQLFAFTTKEKTMRTWFSHVKGEVHGKFIPMVVGSRVCLMLRSGGAIYKSREWLLRERKNIKAVC